MSGKSGCRQVRDACAGGAAGVGAGINLGDEQAEIYREK